MISLPTLIYILCALALLFAGLASPDRLMLLSVDGVLQPHTVVEIQIYRAALAAVAAIGALGTWAWRVGAPWHVIAAVERDYQSWRAPKVHMATRRSLASHALLSSAVAVAVVTALASNQFH